jgi:hypothetical protein
VNRQSRQEHAQHHHKETQATRVSRPTPGEILGGEEHLAENLYAGPGSRQTERKTSGTSHMADPARGGQQPISSRPAYSAFSTLPSLNKATSRCQYGSINHQPELDIPLVQAYRSTRPGKSGPGATAISGFLGGMERSWRSFAELSWTSSSYKNN